MARRGLLTAQDECDARLEILQGLPSNAAAAFAASAAERTLRRVEALGGGDQLARYRNLLDAMWECLAGNEARIGVVRNEVSRLETLLADPDNQNSPELQEADLDHVAAALYAAEALIQGRAEAAANAAGRAIDATWYVAEEDLLATGEAMDIDMAIRVEADPRVQAELLRQRADLEMLAVKGVLPTVLARLRD